MKKILLTCITVCGLIDTPLARAQGGCCAPVGSSTTQDSAARATDCKTLALKVSGMTCPLCAAGVEKSLKTIDGVKAANINLEKGGRGQRGGGVRLCMLTFFPSAFSAAQV